MVSNEATWGIKNYEPNFNTNRVLVARNIKTENPLPGITFPADYAGRVNASFSGVSSSDQAIFALSSIKMKMIRDFTAVTDKSD